MYDKPKVFSLWGNKPFVSHFHSIEVMAETDVFVQCLAFDIVLPIIPTRNHLLNIFEETVLKLGNLSVHNTERIAELICFDRDLVQFIQNKLLTLGYVEKNYAITSRGKAYLDEIQKSKNEVKNTYGKVFINKSTNRLLPYIHIGEFQFEDVSECDGSGIEINVGSVGKSRIVKGNRIVYPKEMGQIISPSQRDIRKNIVRFNRICEAETVNNRIKVDPLYMIEVSPSYETVYVHCKLVQQKGNVDSIIVSDGFSLTNEDIAGFIQKHYRQVIDRLKQSAAWRSEQEGNKAVFVGKKYFEVEKLLECPVEIGETTDERKVKSSDNNKKLAKYYSAIEWAMNYHLKQNPVDKALLDLYCLGSIQENIEKISKFAKSIGLYHWDKYDFLFGMNAGNIRRFEHGEPPQMQTVLSLSIIGAKYNQSSAFHSVVRDFRDIIKFIAELKPYRDSQSHGGSQQKMLSTEEILEIYQKTVKLVKLILPDYEKQDSITNDNVDISQHLVNADVALTKELGAELYSQLSNEIKNLLRQVSPNKNSNELPEPFNYILILACLLENILRNAISELISIHSSISLNQSRSEIVDKITKVRNDKCPVSLSTVEPKNIYNALQGKNSTLGGYVLAFVALLDTEPESNQLSSIVEVADEILRLRRHGNDVGLSMSIERLNELRDEVIKIIKVVGGII